MIEQSLQKAVRIDALKPIRAQEKLQVEVVVANNHDQPVFVIDRVRRIQYDEGEGTLHLWFSDHRRDLENKGPLKMEFSVPKVSAIDKGRSRTIKAQLPVQMTRLVTHADGTFHLEALDLTGARQVAVHVAVDSVPFYRSQKIALSKQLTGWGAEIEARADVQSAAAVESSKESPGQSSASKARRR